MIKKTRLFLLILVSILLLGTGFAVCAQDAPQVVIRNMWGDGWDIRIELYPEAAPVTVANFLEYVNSDFYDGLLFHRVIQDFMIQGGGYEPGLIPRTEGERPPIINESYNGLSNVRGTIAMARTSDPNSATSEFFINQVDNLFLDRENALDGYGYCVFGRVLSGMDVVDYIADLPTYYINGMNDVPLFPYNEGLFYVVMPEIILWLEGDLNNDGIVNNRDLSLLALDWGKTEEGLVGDVDGIDGVDEKDLEKLMFNWLRKADWNMRGDINNDGVADMKDFSILARSWGMAGEKLPTDLDRNESVDGFDLDILIGDWLERANSPP